MSNTVVLGAGLTGLAAGMRLAEAGHRTYVVERLPSVGGLAATIEVDGFRFDQGPHGYHATNPETMAAFSELAGGRLQGQAKDFHVNFRGRLYRYPLRAGDMIRTMPPVTAALCLADYFSVAASGLFNHRVDKSMEDWVVNRFGRTIYDIFFGPYTQKVWGIHPSRLDPSFAKYRIPHLNLWSVLVKSFAKGTNRLTGKEHRLAPLILEFYYHPRGSGAIPEEMARRIRAASGEILLSAEVVGIEVRGGRAKSVTVRRQDGTEDRLECDFVVSTIPLNVMYGAIHPAPDPELLAVARRLHSRSVLIVCLVVARQPVFASQSIYFSNKTFNRLSDLRNWGGHEMYPDGSSGLTVEMTCDRGDRFWNLSDEDLCDLILEELQEERIVRREEIVRQAVVRLDDHYPVYELNYERRLRLLADYLHTVPNLLTGGRQGLFKYIDMDIAVESGFEMAQQILSGADKPPNEGPIENRLFI